MALDSAAATAAATAYYDSQIGPKLDALANDPTFGPITAETRASIRTSYIADQVVYLGAIFNAIKANAEVTVTPDGTPAMEAGGDPVTGNGKGAIT